MNEKLDMRINKEMLEELRRISAIKGVPYSKLIRKILQDFIDKENK